MGHTGKRTAGWARCRSRWVAALALVPLTLAFAACGRGGSAPAGNGGGKVYSIKIASTVARSDPSTQSLIQYGKNLEAASSGRIKVQVYASGEVGTEANEVEQVKNGSLQMVMGAGSFFEPYEKGLEVFDLPLLFNSTEGLYKAFDGPLGQDVSQTMEKDADLKVLETYSFGAAYYESKIRPLTKPADFEGLKIRLKPTKVLSDSYSLLGAQPVNVDFSEAYSAIQQGVCNTLAAPLTNYYSSKLYEVAPYLTMFVQAVTPSPWVVNNDFYKSLPADLQQLVQSEADKTNTAYRAALAKSGDELVTQLKAKNVKINTPAASLSGELKSTLAPEYTKVAAGSGPNGQRWLSMLDNGA
jgi:tripartite ATP-independent transporter DctP family solute receptor